MVDKCEKQKTDVEDEYPQNNGNPKQPVCIEYEIPKAAVKLSKDGCNMVMLCLFSDETGRTVLNSLKTIYLIRSDTSQG